MRTTILDEEDKRRSPFTEEFIALCKKYNVGVEGGDPWYGIELFEIEDFQKYEESVRNDFKHILRNIEIDDK